MADEGGCAAGRRSVTVTTESRAPSIALVLEFTDRLRKRLQRLGISPSACIGPAGPIRTDAGRGPPQTARRQHPHRHFLRIRQLLVRLRRPNPTAADVTDQRPHDMPGDHGRGEMPDGQARRRNSLDLTSGCASAARSSSAAGHRKPAAGPTSTGRAWAPGWSGSPWTTEYRVAYPVRLDGWLTRN